MNDNVLSRQTAERHIADRYVDGVETLVKTIVPDQGIVLIMVDKETIGHRVVTIKDGDIYTSKVGALAAAINHHRMAIADMLANGTSSVQDRNA